VRRLRDWALTALGPRPGEVAVDVGSGTGEDVQAIAQAVGTPGRAVGVEPHPGIRAEAVRRAAAAGSAATFVAGDASALPFEDGSVDVLRSERVWQHLGDPAAAAREVARVLSPRGRAAIMDTDWATMLQSHGDPHVIDRLRGATLRRMANPFSGRHLRRLLVEAGLEVDHDMGSTALIFPLEALRRPGMMQQNLALAVAEGSVTQAEADRHLAEVLAAAEAGTLHVSVTMFCAVARRR
jgi:SAM-dependent methyltransferase